MRRLLHALLPTNFPRRLVAVLGAIGAMKFVTDGPVASDAHPDYDVDVEAGTTTPPPAAPTGVTPAAPTGTESSSTQPPRPAGEVPGAPAPDQSQRGEPPQNVPYRRFEEVSRAAATEREARIRLEERTRILEEQLRGRGQQPTPPAVEESQDDKDIRENLERLYPALKTLKDLPVAKIMANMERVESIDANDQARWEEVGRAAWAALDKQVVDHYGGPIEDAEMKDTIDLAFQSWLRRSPEAQAMYLRQDPNLVPTFWSRYTGAIVRPAVRKAEAASVTTAQQRQPRAPRGGNASVVASAPKQPSVKDPDAVHDAAADAFLARRG
jgi:hypothetical protein